MESDSGAPIACTLQPGDYRKRLAWIAELARDGLVGVSRDDLRLELKYAPHVAVEQSPRAKRFGIRKGGVMGGPLMAVG